MKTPEDLVGEEVQCPSCGQTFVASESRAEPPSQAAAGGYRVVEESYDKRPDTSRREHWSPEPDAVDDYAPGPERAHHGALPGGGKALAATILLFVWILTAVFLIIVDVAGLLLIQRQRRGELPNMAELNAFDSIERLAGLLQSGVYLVTVIVYLIWVYQAHKNLTLFDVRGLTYSPGWAVGWYFIPFLNLVRPCQGMQELWKASDPDQPLADPNAWRDSRGSALIGLWWALWIIGSIIGNIAFRVTFAANNPTLEQIEGALYASILADAVLIPAAFCLVIIIQLIQRRQHNLDERFLSREERY